jgi:hypothetical protein
VCLSRALVLTRSLFGRPFSSCSENLIYTVEEDIARKHYTRAFRRSQPSGRPERAFLPHPGKVRDAHRRNLKQTSRGDPKRLFNQLRLRKEGWFETARLWVVFIACFKEQLH